LIFDGDRETLVQTYYFDLQNRIFYIKNSYHIFAPPKWEAGSKEINSLTSEYIILNGTIPPLIKKNGNTPFDLNVKQNMDKVILLNELPIINNRAK
ncbi:MAG: hypothetical protein LBV46_01690, partial [Bacteroidales bacterium]|nr:hypothetical protein [Bacteroidales bacterium]